MRGFSGLLILILMTLVILAIIFATTKFVLPNPETVEESNKMEQDAQDAVNQLQQKSIENQSVEVE